MLNYQKCPRCSTATPWKILWLKSWIWPQWRCKKCYSLLGFNDDRRIFSIMITIAIYSAFHYYDLLGNSHNYSYFFLFLFIWYLTFRLLDGVELKEL